MHVAQQPAAATMLGGGRAGDRLQATFLAELVQVHVAQLQPGLLAVAVLLAAAGVEESVALARPQSRVLRHDKVGRSEEHTSELQSLLRNSFAVFCWQKKQKMYKSIHINQLI